MKIGVVVGKFQVPYLTASHVCLLNWAASECDHLVVFILEKEIEFSDSNPVPLGVRRDLIKKALTSDYSILPLQEQKYSSSVCTQIDSALLNHWSYAKDTFTLFSGKEGFAKYYKGICNIKIKDFPGNITSKALRNYAKDIESFDKEIVAGMIKAVTYKPPVCYNYITSIVKVNTGLVVTRSPGAKLFSFPTISLTPEHSSFKEASLENLKKYLKGTINEGYQMGSIKVEEDWRFRDTNDYCYYHLIHHISRDVELMNCEIMERPLEEGNFESEFVPIIKYLNSFNNAR